jgi:hypothetical protein
VNVTLIVQLLLGATLEQVFVCENCAASAPVRLTPLIVSVALPVLLTVTVCAELVVFTAVWPKLRLAGLTEIAGAVPPA